MNSYAHNSQALCEPKISLFEIVFHARLRILITFELDLQRDSYRHCTSQLCYELPLHSHYEKSNLNPFS